MIKNISIFTFYITASLLISGCELPVFSPDKKFGKQNFVSAIALIELHNTRNGNYPESLSDLQFLGDWDAIWISAVKYKKTKDGYDLHLTRGWVGVPDLTFDIKFKQGLGIQKTNIRWSD